jgi:hypothetical protein
VPQITCRDKNNNPVTYTGVITNNEPCSSYCGPGSNIYYKTDLSGKGMEEEKEAADKTGSFMPLPGALDFKVEPTLAHESVTFSTTADISKLVIFDMAGKKVMEQTSFDNGTINISQLQNGVHYIQVHFNTSEIRTIKIMKQ